MKRIILFVLAAICIISSCKKEDDPCAKDPCSYQTPEAEVKAIQTYLDTNRIVATKHCSGIFYVITDPGVGASPTPCSAVSVTYRGTRLDGVEFDKSTVPVSFNLSGLIEGWKIGLPLLKTNGKIRLYIPPSLGYGAAAVGDKLPPNSVLVFDLTLLAFR